jgi:hypothetical protein
MLQLRHQFRSHERLHRRAEPLFVQLNPGTAHTYWPGEFAKRPAFSQAFEYCSRSSSNVLDEHLPV